MDIYESYSVLGLEPGVTEEEIKAQYRKLLQKWHPDRNRASKQKEAEATEKTALLNSAYQIIKSHIIPYTIPKPETSTAGTGHQGANGQKQSGGAASSMARESAKSTARQAPRDVSYSSRPYNKPVKIDGSMTTGWKIIIGAAVFVSVAVIFYSLTEGMGLSLADLIMARTDSPDQTTNNSGINSTTPGTVGAERDPYAVDAPSVDAQNGNQYPADPYATQNGASGSGAGQGTNYGSGYYGSGAYGSGADGSNSVTQENGAYDNASPSGGDSSNYNGQSYYDSYRRDGRVGRESGHEEYDDHDDD